MKSWMFTISFSSLEIQVIPYSRSASATDHLDEASNMLVSANHFYLYLLDNGPFLAATSCVLCLKGRASASAADYGKIKLNDMMIRRN